MPVASDSPMSHVAKNFVNQQTIAEIWRRMNKHLEIVSAHLAKTATSGTDEYDLTGASRPCDKSSSKGVTPGYYSVSAHEFALAIDEFTVDLAFMKTRRALRNGISPGKLLGALVFRLCRHRIVHLEKFAVNLKNIDKLQEVAVLFMALEFLDVDVDESQWIQSRLIGGAEATYGDSNNVFSKAGYVRERYIENIPQEIIYILKKRHYNQETLAALFDTLVILDQALKELCPKVDGCQHRLVS